MDDSGLHGHVRGGGSGCRQVTQLTTEAGHKGTLVADSGAWADLSTGSPEEAQSRQRSQA